MDMTELVHQYLAAPERKADVVDEMSRRPREALDAVLGFRGPYPAGMHPIDAHADDLTDLLAELLRRRPELLIGPCPAALPQGRRGGLIAAALATGDPRFTEWIVSSLRDRSLYVKLAVAYGIVRSPLLRTAGAVRELQRVMRLKSIAGSDYLLERFREALEACGRDA